MEQADRIKESVARLNALSEQLKNEQIDKDQALELLKECAGVAADAVERLESLSSSLEE